MSENHIYDQKRIDKIRNSLTINEMNKLNHAHANDYIDDEVREIIERSLYRTMPLEDYFLNLGE